MFEAADTLPEVRVRSMLVSLDFARRLDLVKVQVVAHFCTCNSYLILKYRSQEGSIDLWGPSS